MDKKTKQKLEKSKQQFEETKKKHDLEKDLKKLQDELYAPSYEGEGVEPRDEQTNEERQELLRNYNSLSRRNNSNEDLAMEEEDDNNGDFKDAVYEPGKGFIGVVNEENRSRSGSFNDESDPEEIYTSGYMQNEQQSESSNEDMSIEQADYMETMPYVQIKDKGKVPTLYDTLVQLIRNVKATDISPKEKQEAESMFNSFISENLKKTDKKRAVPALPVDIDQLYKTLLERQSKGKTEPSNLPSGISRLWNKFRPKVGSELFLSFRAKKLAKRLADIHNARVDWYEEGDKLDRDAFIKDATKIIKENDEKDKTYDDLDTSDPLYISNRTYREKMQMEKTIEFKKQSMMPVEQLLKQIAVESNIKSDLLARIALIIASKQGIIPKITIDPSKPVLGNTKINVNKLTKDKNSQILKALLKSSLGMEMKHILDKLIVLENKEYNWIEEWKKPYEEGGKGILVQLRTFRHIPGLEYFTEQMAKFASLSQNDIYPSSRIQAKTFASQTSEGVENMTKNLFKGMGTILIKHKVPTNDGTQDLDDVIAKLSNVIIDSDKQDIDKIIEEIDKNMIISLSESEQKKLKNNILKSKNPTLIDEIVEKAIFQHNFQQQQALEQIEKNTNRQIIKDELKTSEGFFNIARQKGKPVYPENIEFQRAYVDPYFKPLKTENEYWLPTIHHVTGLRDFNPKLRIFNTKLIGSIVYIKNQVITVNPGGNKISFFRKFLSFYDFLKSWQETYVVQLTVNMSESERNKLNNFSLNKRLRQKIFDINYYFQSELSKHSNVNTNTQNPSVEQLEIMKLTEYVKDINVINIISNIHSDNEYENVFIKKHKENIIKQLTDKSKKLIQQIQEIPNFVVNIFELDETDDLNKLNNIVKQLFSISDIVLDLFYKYNELMSYINENIIEINQTKSELMNCKKVMRTFVKDKLIGENGVLIKALDTLKKCIGIVNLMNITLPVNTSWINFFEVYENVKYGIEFSNKLYLLIEVITSFSLSRGIISFNIPKKKLYMLDEINNANTESIITLTNFKLTINKIVKKILKVPVNFYSNLNAILNINNIPNSNIYIDIDYDVYFEKIQEVGIGHFHKNINLYENYLENNYKNELNGRLHKVKLELLEFEKHVKDNLKNSSDELLKSIQKDRSVFKNKIQKIEELQKNADTYIQTQLTALYTTEKKYSFNNLNIYTEIEEIKIIQKFCKQYYGILEFIINRHIQQINEHINKHTIVPIYNELLKYQETKLKIKKLIDFITRVNGDFYRLISNNETIIVNDEEFYEQYKLDETKYNIYHMVDIKYNKDFVKECSSIEQKIKETILSDFTRKRKNDNIIYNEAVQYAVININRLLEDCNRNTKA